MTVDANAATRQIVPTLRTKVGRIADLLKGAHGPNEPLFLSGAIQSPEFDTVYEDFQWETITASAGPFTAGSANAMAYAESNAGATDPAKLAPTELDPSSMQLATTAFAYGQTVSVGTKRFTADCFASFEVRMKVSQITDIALAVGFADALPASAAKMFNIDTGAFVTVADGAFYALDTGATLKTAALVSGGTTTAATKIAVSPTGAPFGLPTAATWFTVRVCVVGNGINTGASDAFLFVNGALVASQLAKGPDSEKLMMPFIYQASPAGTAVTVQYDYFLARQQKGQSPF